MSEQAPPEPAPAEPAPHQPAPPRPIPAPTVRSKPVRPPSVSAQPVSAQPVSAQPVSAQPVSSQPVSGQPVSGQPVSAEPALPPPVVPVAAPRKRFGGKILLRIAAALLVGLAVYLVKGVVFADRAKDARVGDCIAAGTAAGASGATRARVIDCGSAEAAFTVAGRVDGETDTEGTHCDRFFADGEKYLIFSSTAGGGYLLCLRSRR